MSGPTPCWSTKQICIKIHVPSLSCPSIGGNYLARFLSGDDPKASVEETIRHDKALEAYQAAYAKYQKERTKLLDWIETQHEIKEQGKQNFTYTYYAFKPHNQAHHQD